MEMENVGTVPSSSSSPHTSWLRGKCLGKGSFGFVHLAVKKSDSQIFAVKSVDRDNCLPSQIESIENEIQILRSISSPYIVKYLSDDVTAESPSMTSLRNLHLEYMPGGTVADMVEQFGGKGGDVDNEGDVPVRSYTWCILSALQYLHAKGIAHCDVKGRNILVGHEPGTCKLADFGSAMGACSDRRREKTPVNPRGSPLWMAPEVVRGEYQGPESDVWSLGCTVIEMISGKPAWKDEGVDTLCRIGFSDELPEFPTQLSELGRDFLSKCLRREQSERWSCDQLLQHPFVTPFSTNTVAESSPRCVLDWNIAEFSDEDDEESELSSNSTIGVREISARGRISELASTSGAIWESDGWMVVRDDGGEDCGDDEEGEGTSWENLELTRGEIEIEIEKGGTSLEYSNTERTSWEYLKRLSGGVLVMSYSYVTSDGGFGGCGLIAGSRCRYGLAVEWQDIIGFYSCCWCKLLKLILLFHLMTIILFIFFNWLYSVTYIFLFLNLICTFHQLFPKLRPLKIDWCAIHNMSEANRDCLTLVYSCISTIIIIKIMR